MNQAITEALEIVAREGVCLRRDWRLAWPAPMQELVYRFRLWEPGSPGPILVAVMGGASSGKSTVFNNLLGGHLTSRITARGHATRGPILAVHEDQRERIEQLLGDGRLLPGLRRVPIELDGNVSGEPDAVAMLYHHLDPLRNILLFDMPDLTSQASATEGEVALTLLPWFDRLVVVVDHERWFDRQTVSELRAYSVRSGQDRLVLFNRTREEDLADEDEAALRVQAERLAAQRMLVLGFRRGRGFCLFVPGTLDEVVAFLATPGPKRTGAMIRQLSEAANRVLNENEERAVGLAKLHESLGAAVARVLPSTWDCMTSQMTPRERKQLEVFSRIFRLYETGSWFTAQTRRVRSALQGIPGIGVLLRSAPPPDEPIDDNADRITVTKAFYQSTAQRQIHEVQRVVRASKFWSELERWTGQRPSARAFEWTPALVSEVQGVAERFDAALDRWTEKVKSECQGISPTIHGAVGAGVIALAVVLIAVPGPITALTLVSAKGAIGAGLAHLAASTGAGAVLGRHIGRLSAVIQEKLLGSAEFEAVQASAAAFRGLLEDAGRELVAAAADEAAAYVMPSGDRLTAALEVLRNGSEDEVDD